MSKIEFLENCYQFKLITKEKYISSLKEIKSDLGSPYGFYFKSESYDKINEILAGLI